MNCESKGLFRTDCSMNSLLPEILMTSKEINDFIDNELTRQSSLDSKSGLTDWAIIVGIASLCWLLIGLLERQNGLLDFRLLGASSTFLVVFLGLVFASILESLHRQLWP